MADQKTVYGRITCPHCHMPESMRITEDKNGQPFGFCDVNCAGQLKVGGNPYRVNKFYEAHPGIARAMKGEPEPEIKPENPVTGTEAKKPGFSLDQLM
jgi:hypothetical protein